MTTLILEKTTTAQWYELVKEAQQQANKTLDEELESYLVFLLIRFMQSPELVKRILAVQYLQSYLDTGQRRQQQLQIVGDQCLLFAGMYPEQAQKRQVKVRYFVELGQSAYRELANISSGFYHTIAKQFLTLMEILLSIRYLGKQALKPLLAIELSQDLGCNFAYQQLQQQYNWPHLAHASITKH